MNERDKTHKKNIYVQYYFIYIYIPDHLHILPTYQGSNVPSS